MSGKVVLPPERKRSSDDFRFCSIQVRKPGDGVTAQTDLLQGCDLDIEYEVIKPVRNIILGFRLWTSSGLCVLTSTDADNEPSHFLAERGPGRYMSSCHLASQYLRAGRYVLDIAASIPNVRMLDEIPSILAFEVVDTGSLDGTTFSGAARCHRTCSGLDNQTNPLKHIGLGIGQWVGITARELRHGNAIRKHGAEATVQSSKSQTA